MGKSETIQNKLRCIRHTTSLLEVLRKKISQLKLKYEAMKANKGFMTQLDDNVFDSLRSILLYTRPFKRSPTTFQTLYFCYRPSVQPAIHCSLEMAGPFSFLPYPSFPHGKSSSSHNTELKHSVISMCIL